MSSFQRSTSISSTSDGSTASLREARVPRDIPIHVELRLDEFKIGVVSVEAPVTGASTTPAEIERSANP
jgi:hypothetical protein